ncbi:MAG TPA: S41 family peptidase [Candidatus Acidoferrales bacterium]|jgi:carboxyl-terminal processing protease|nr:S41 family peptidase [Candidatus Acidoferrales bacterium]
MSTVTRNVVIVLSVVVFGFVAVGYVRGRSVDDKAYRALTVYSEVLEHIQRDYVDEPDIHQVTSGALHGLLDSLDAQSSYLSPLEYKDYQEKSATPAKAEAGLAVTKRFGYISVIATLPDSPAAKANLQIGDIIEKIGDFTTGQMGIEQANLLLSGEPGTVVNLSVIRRGKTEPQDVPLTLEKLAPPKVIEDKLQQGDVAYIHLSDFDAGTTKQLREDLQQFQHQGAHKLILDLRDCAFGQDSEGISAAQLFLSSGTITSLKGQTMTAVVSSADPAKVVWTQPVAVLIGNGTAGPAEIVASAIADNHRGETVGQRSYGVASEQKLIQLDDGSALILTIANYYTPSGKEIPIDGVTPTKEVIPALPDDVAAVTDQNPAPPSSSPNDPVVKKALEVLAGGAAQKAA